MNDYSLDFINTDKKTYACYIMEKTNFPRTLVDEFREYNKVCMSQPDGSVIYELPDFIKEKIEVLGENILVYHIIHTCIRTKARTVHFYNLMYIDDDMLYERGLGWNEVNVIQLNDAGSLNNATISIARNRNGMKFMLK